MIRREIWDGIYFTKRIRPFSVVAAKAERFTPSVVLRSPDGLRPVGDYAPEGHRGVSKGSGFRIVSCNS